MHNVATTRFGSGRVIDSESRNELTISSTVNPDFLGLAATDPDLLTLRGLASYIDHLRRNNLDTAVFEIGFWSRIARMFAVVVVTLLALPFVFGPLRTTGAGTRTVIGVMLGVVFFLVTRTVENGGQLFGLNPALVGWLPTALIGCATLARSRYHVKSAPSAPRASATAGHARPDARGRDTATAPRARPVPTRGTAQNRSNAPGRSHRPARSADREQMPGPHAEGLAAAQSS